MSLNSFAFNLVYIFSIAPIQVSLSNWLRSSSRKRLLAASSHLFIYFIYFRLNVSLKRYGTIYLDLDFRYSVPFAL